MAVPGFVFVGFPTDAAKVGSLKLAGVIRDLSLGEVCVNGVGCILLHYIAIVNER